MFDLPSHRLHHDLTTVPARFATIDFRMVANMGADRTGRDAQHEGDFGAVLSLLEHLGNGFDILFSHG